jgi:hypothetical protein
VRPAVFQIGDSNLVLRSADAALVDGFLRLYGDCRVEVSAARGASVECVVHPAVDAQGVMIDVIDPEPPDIALFMETAFADRGCQRLPALNHADGWQPMQSDEPRVVFAVRGQQVRFPARSAWRALAANLGVGLVVRLQRDIIFLHASAIAIGKSRRGVVFVGPKATGKTTMALGLASRGHTFLGDEIVGVRETSREIVPVLRTISKRDGPCAAGVDETIAAMSPARTRYPDGHSRTNIRASSLYPAGLVPSRLEAIVFLGAVGPVPQLTPVPSSLETASRLTPVTSTLWGRSPTSRALALVRLLASVPGYWLQLGPPDATSECLEHAFAD